MHLAIAVIASPGQQYEDMKNLWLQNLSNFYKTFDQINNIKLSTYFLYGKNKGGGHFNASELSYSIRPTAQKASDTDLSPIYDFFVNDLSEDLRNIITKTLIFCKYIVEDAPSKPDFILRTNLSTLFDIPKFIKHLDTVTQQNSNKLFYGGTFVHGFLGLRTWFSGTNITFSLPVAKLLTKHFFVINAFPALDDVSLSSFLVNQYPDAVCFFNIPRIDFVENVFLQYTSTVTDLEEVFCFRFKTKNRQHDTKAMNTFLNSNFDKELVRIEIRKRHKFVLTQKNELWSNPFFFQITK